MARLDHLTVAARRALAAAAPPARRGVESARAGLGSTRGRLVAAAALAAVVLLAVVVLSGDEGTTPGQAGDVPDERVETTGDRLPEQVSSLLDQMSTERKVAQLMLVGLEGTDTGDPVFATLEKRDYAGLVIDARNYVSGDQVSELADEAVSMAGDARHVTPLVLARQEGGEFNAFADLPPDDPPAELSSRREAAEAAEETADALKEVGVTGILGPVLDVGTEAGSALGARLYSDDPAQVTDYALATIEAFEEAGLFSAAKHFPGLGGASQSPEFGSANVGLSLEQLAERDLIPFAAAIEAGVPGIVVGHGLYGVDDFVTPASMSKAVMTHLLRDDLGFEGVAIADDLTSPAITAAFTPADAAVDSVRSGADLVYVSVDDREQTAVYEALLEAVRRERIPPERLDEAVTRTLVAKEEAGLLGEEDGGGRSRGEDGSGSREGGGGRSRGDGGSGSRDGGALPFTDPGGFGSTSGG